MKTKPVTAQFREQWLTRAANKIAMSVLNKPDQISFKVSLFTTRSTKIRSEVWPKAKSESAVSEIFISARIDSPMVLCEELTHRLINAMLDDTGYGPTFQEHARRADLIPQQHYSYRASFATTKAGAVLKDQLHKIIDSLGAYPHASLDTQAKSKGRNSHKITCMSCGFKVNTSNKWITQVNLSAHCYGCMSTNLQIS